MTVGEPSLMFMGLLGKMLRFKMGHYCVSLGATAAQGTLADTAFSCSRRPTQSQKPIVVLIWDQ